MLQLPPNLMVSKIKHDSIFFVFVTIFLPVVPYLSPVFLNETFDSIQTGNGKRNITLFWIPVSVPKYSNTMNQEKFHYIIEVTSITDAAKYNHQIVKSNEFHFTFSNLSVISTYNFRISSRNDHGLSITFTEITIEEERALPPKLENLQVFSYGKGHYELRWEKIVNIDHYVLSWCPRGGNGRCIEKIESEVVRQQLSRTLSNLTDRDRYNFGVSSVIAINNNTKLVSSGIAWASCVIPKKPNKLLFRLANIGINSLQLQWKLESCPGLYAVISRFEIIYCHFLSKNGPCEKENRIFVNNSRVQSYKLEGLHPNSFYRVTMKVWNNNTVSEESYYLKVRTGIEITFGALIYILVVVMIGIVWLIFF